MLSRCKKGMVVVAKREFLENRASETLLGLLAREFEDRWVKYEDLVAGSMLFNQDVRRSIKLAFAVRSHGISGPSGRGYP